MKPLDESIKEFAPANVDENIKKRLKIEIEKYNLPLELVANIGRMPITTFKDKYLGTASWKASDLPFLSLYFGITTDEFIFTDKDTVIKSGKRSQQILKESVKEHLIKEKKFKLLGKLTADGYFNE